MTSRPNTCLGWRKAARPGRLVLPAAAPSMFVPVVTAVADPDGANLVGKQTGLIVIEIAGAVVRVKPGIDLGWLRDVLRAVKAAT